MTTTKADITASNRVLKRAVAKAAALIREGQRDQAEAVMTHAGFTAAILLDGGKP